MRLEGAFAPNTRAGTNIGVGGSAGGQVQIREVQLDADGTWWGALIWENQTLGSTELSEIEVTAQVKGTHDALNL